MITSPFLIERFKKNEQGNDWVVGDVHGQFSKLKAALDENGFNSSDGDRLFHVGDLIGRGDESESVLDWLDQPWVYAIRGNHEEMIIDYHEGELPALLLWRNGEEWFLDLSESDQARYVERFKQLPYAIELESPHGVVLIVHADFHLDSWKETLDLAKSHPDGLDFVKKNLLWSRDRLNGDLVGERVEDVFKVVSGHTVVDEPVAMGNRLFLDTGGWFHDRNFAFYNATKNYLFFTLSRNRLDPSEG